MEYGKLIAVTGLPGLFELVSSKNDGAIVRSLEDNSTKFASTRQHQFSHLESIEVYTVRDNVNLIDIFKAMQDDGGKLPEEKDAKAVKAYFEKVYPDLDFERVYASDMKKMVKWFGVITAKGIELKLTEQLIEEEAPVEEAVVAEVEEAKPAKKAAKKKAEAPAEEAGEEAPKKKTTRKKKED
ncbi:hypothetical protein ESA94_09095 [Lacibacter luteus]|uniref:Uncharacterized protein n=1 Tax=Lacibacter luteus TaxID=2508719 RepID=A0A4Q1CJ41_9BACT|nr:DUF5606 domain-containing protein [Lacibacter luteus]RXK60609.1 hypothetical protein ESA94_09095 [Lacibacter luteus]